MRPTTFVCAHCGVEFPVPKARGPIPRYCRESHRQLAYQARRVAAAFKAGQEAAKR